MSQGFTEVCPLDELPEDGTLQIDLDGQCILVCRTGDIVSAVDGICPHRGAQLGQGQRQGKAIICPWHDWAFDVETGCGLTNPNSQLKCYNIKVEAGMVYIAAPDE